MISSIQVNHVCIINVCIIFKHEHTDIFQVIAEIFLFTPTQREKFYLNFLQSFYCIKRIHDYSKIHLYITFQTPPIPLSHSTRIT